MSFRDCTASTRAFSRSFSFSSRSFFRFWRPSLRVAVLICGVSTAVEGSMSKESAGGVAVSVETVASGTGAGGGGLLIADCISVRVLSKTANCWRRSRSSVSRLDRSSRRLCNSVWYFSLAFWVSGNSWKMSSMSTKAMTAFCFPVPLVRGSSRD